MSQNAIVFVLIAVMTVAAGCGDPAAPAHSQFIDPAALRLIDESQLNPAMVALLDQATTAGVAGRPVSEFAQVTALADHGQQSGRFDDYEFMLPLLKSARDRMFQDELVHSPYLTIRVNRDSGIIQQFRLVEMRF